MLDYLDNAAIGLHWVDGNGTILWANPSGYEPLGYSAEEHIGRNITEFHAEADVINDILVRLLGGETLYNYKAKLLRKDGTTQSVLIASSGMESPDTPGWFNQPARMSVWTALTRVVARLGLERILRRIFQFLISALACSPGPCCWAWAVLTSFWWQFDWSLDGVAHSQVAWIRSSAACSVNGLVISL
jgi:PAS domain S-box-containing protein